MEGGVRVSLPLGVTATRTVLFIGGEEIKIDSVSFTIEQPRNTRLFPIVLGGQIRNHLSDFLDALLQRGGELQISNLRHNSLLFFPAPLLGRFLYRSFFDYVNELLLLLFDEREML